MPRAFVYHSFSYDDVLAVIRQTPTNLQSNARQCDQTTPVTW